MKHHHHHHLSTPLNNEQLRSSSLLTDLSSRRSKETPLRKPPPLQPPKVPKKSLNGAFTSVSEAASDSSPISTITSASSPSEAGSDLSFKTGQKGAFQLNPDPSSSPEKSPLSGLTPSSRIAVIGEPSDVSLEPSGIDKPDFSKVGAAMEADVVANLLEEARSQVLNSDDVDLQSKKLMKMLIQIVTADFHALPEDRDRTSDYVAVRARNLMFCFLIWTFAVLMMFFFGPRLRSSSSSRRIFPPPT